MILDALTRAEHERQIEKQPDLKFVTPVKPANNKPNNIWLYVGLGVLANAFILFFVIRALSGSAENEMEIAADSAELDQNIDQNLDNTSNATSSVTNTQPQIQPTVKSVQPESQQASQPQAITEAPIQAQIPITSPSLAQDNFAEDRPLAMEANSLQTPEVDRPLLYESKQLNAKPKQASAAAKTSTSLNKGKVSFSSTELSVDDAAPIINKPKLLIDQGNEVSNNIANARASAGSVPNVRDLPESSRASLNQYEVNVHVFDDNPTRSFVLINMDKYKEGDRIANNGPLVQAITSEGVVVDYGSGRALLPAK